MAKEKYDEEESEDAKFNMAIDTLKRLGEILREIKQLTFHAEFSDSMKQGMKINLVKQFFNQSSPLLGKENVDKYKDEVLNLKPKYSEVVETNFGRPSKKTGGIVPVFDWELEKRLDEILIELQQILQEKKYFMPPASGEGFY